MMQVEFHSTAWCLSNQLTKNQLIIELIIELIIDDIIMNKL